MRAGPLSIVDGRQLIAAGRKKLRRYGQGSYRLVSVKGLKQEGELSVLDGGKITTVHESRTFVDRQRQTVDRCR